MIDPLHNGAAVVIVYAIRLVAEPKIPLVAGVTEFVVHGASSWSTIFPLGWNREPNDLRYHIYQIIPPGIVPVAGSANRGVYSIVTEGVRFSEMGPRGSTTMKGWLPGLGGSWTIPELRADNGTLATAIKSVWPVRLDENLVPITEPVYIPSSLAGGEYSTQQLNYSSVSSIPEALSTFSVSSLNARDEIKKKKK